MDRVTWLRERRASVEADYTRDAPTYDDGYDPVTPVHRRFVDRLIDTTPERGTLLDAPCGTGPYFGIVLAAGRHVVGADQSAGMLARARTKHPQVRLEQVGLQELSYDAEFDAAMCVDAIEHVPPEEWPLVLANLRRAIRPGGHLYLTVEEVDRGRLERAFEEATAAGLPVVFGDRADEGTGGYHHYPDRAQVRRWLDHARLAVVAEGDEWLDGYGYHHLLVRTGS
ncbi:MAG TPA: methyltransferase domain-containing protein [Actinomycetota bacterium]